MVSMKFTPTPEKKKLRVDINENVFQELELYLTCAKETYPWLQLDMVVEQLLDDALKNAADNLRKSARNIAATIKLSQKL